MDPVDLLLHPVRLRIVHAMAGGRTLTTSDLCGLLPDVSKATVYRHVGLLADAGVLDVEGEQRVRGAVERRYRLLPARAAIDAETAASASRDDHRRAFAVAMATLLAEFNAYLDRDQADPAADLVGYRQHAIWLSEDERAGLIADLRAALVARMGNRPAPERTRHLISPILFPAEEPPE
ncbi:MAG: helix-turn-helix domain-containing protein [Nonomuraea sp.]|nr:helix-turn-helix domain-containing protein [Nonomuraea sp.]NUP60663.1 helix-turn-helix domain-containing protein [Nonomuraea sp.]NUP77240.1 helix-turn-helix domain-containing protein [Nonomuraea sp.]NUS02953.1 helix-turn-helix domain-containing protein [Nonomuraea sp.]NUT40273.1 helix-turn-helix domain-containing protein [Thermoactinospora sp.]